MQEMYIVFRLCMFNIAKISYLFLVLFSYNAIFWGFTKRERTAILRAEKGIICVDSCKRKLTTNTTQEEKQ